MPKWTAALIDKVEEITGSRKFTYILAATKIIGDKKSWENNKDVLQLLGNPIKVISMKEMFDYLSDNMTTTPAGSDIGRLIQVLKAYEIINKGSRCTLPKVITFGLFAME